MQHVITRTGIELDVGEVRRVSMTAPWRWLALGWRDMARAPAASIGYGALFVALGYLVTWQAWQAPWLMITLATGFLLVAPVFAIVFYALSRELEQGRHASLRTALAAWRGKAVAVTLYAAALGMMLVFWIMFTMILTAMSVYAANASMVASLQGLLTTTDGWLFLMVYMGSGAVLAALVYLGAAVALPMMLDRGADPVTAVVTSARAVLANPRPMALWALLIVVLTGAGIASFYLGIALVLPLVSHATWHAYRDLVGD